MLVKYALYENKYDFTGTDLISIDTREQVMEIVPDLLTADQMQTKNVDAKDISMWEDIDVDEVHEFANAFQSGQQVKQILFKDNRVREVGIKWN